MVSATSLASPTAAAPLLSPSAASAAKMNVSALLAKSKPKPPSAGAGAAAEAGGGTVTGGGTGAGADAAHPDSSLAHPLFATRDVFQCVGCLHFGVPCRRCPHGMAQRGTPPEGRLNVMTPVPPPCSHDPVVEVGADKEGGVWEDAMCGLCNGAHIEHSAGVLGPRMCSSCIACTDHTWRRERPGLGIGPAEAVGGRRGTALGLGSRLMLSGGSGIDAFDRIHGQGSWYGAEEPWAVDVDGAGDTYTCNACGVMTVKCRSCDVGMAVVDDDVVDDDGGDGSGGGGGGGVPDGYPDPAAAAAEEERDGLCVLCNGFLEADEEFQKHKSTLRRGPSKLYVFVEPANPWRRHLARLLHNLFPGKMDVSPPETRVDAFAPDSSDDEEPLEAAVARELADIEREEAVKRFMGEKAYEAKQKREREEKQRKEEELAARLPSVIAVEVAKKMMERTAMGAVTFLPRAAPMAVYAPHPLAPKSVQILLTDFHTHIASEKAHELRTLCEALGAKRMFPKPPPRRKDSLDSSSDDSDKDGGEDEGSGSDGETARAARAAAATSTEGLIAKWKAHRLTSGAGANSTSAMEQQKRRAALMSVDKRFPLPASGKPAEPSVPYDLLWLRQEPSWLELCDDRIVNSVAVTEVDVTSMKSYGVDAPLNSVLLSPMLLPLQLSLGLMGSNAGPPPKGMPPALRVSALGADDDVDADAAAAQAAARASAQAAVAARGKFAGRFMCVVCLFGCLCECVLVDVMQSLMPTLHCYTGQRRFPTS